MRIAFLTFGLEAGADGIGDYCRGLAEALAARGHSCLIVALSDRHLGGEQHFCDEGGGVSLLRLSSRLKWTRRLDAAGRALDAFAADWASWQVNPYGFQRKGIAFGLTRDFAALTSGLRIHAMAHELWLGLLPRRPLKERIYGVLQRSFLASFLDAVNPLVLHTSCPIYRRALSSLGREAKILPIPSSLPAPSRNAEDSLRSALQAAGLARPRDRIWCLGLFGSIPAHWRPETMLSEVARTAARQERQAVIIQIGRAGGDIDERWAQWSRTFPRVTFLRLGPQPAEIAANLVASLDVGISPYPYCLVGKSSAAAAILENGLPLITTWGDYDSVPPINAPYLWQIRRPAEPIEDFLARAKRQERRAQRPEIVKRLETDLLLGQGSSKLLKVPA